ncbi:MAG: hypothetical protein ACFE95_12720 [Candidatus Hodarchaeota archaeon]
MAQFKVFEKGMQVNGQTIMSIVSGMGAFTRLAERFFRQSGLPSPNEIVADANTWYSQQKWLDAFFLISQKVGSSTLYQIGRNIPKNAVFPPDITSVETALQSIDVAYHMNHRNKHGTVLFDPTRNDRVMLEGIGHYKYEKAAEPNKVVLICENPYPCDFDRGIIVEMARRFDISAHVYHDDTQPCRKRGGNSCTYIVTWKN